MEETNHENSEMADDSLTTELKNEEFSETKLLKSTDSMCKEETDTCLIKKEDLIKLFIDKENTLRNEFQAELTRELMIANEKFDLVLQNEQIRTSYMLREAHRERQEKIISLQKQLECKNLAGLMYVMCSERRKSKLEKLRIIEEYTNYIQVLQAILAESQDLILNLSRGYKTAARVDHEWREKMKLVVGEFQAFVNDFTGATPDENKYFFDLPFLLKINSPVVDNPEEDPCECWDEKFVLEPEEEGEKHWWETVGGDCRPFIMFGDMAEFKPPQRRQVLRAVKAAKTAPPKWKEYVFNDTFLRAECEHIGSIKYKYPQRDSLSIYTQGVQTVESKTDGARRVTGEPTRATLMGSIIKMMASRSASILQSQPETNTAILGAKDSLEIASTTRVLEKSKEKRSEKFSLNEDIRKSTPPDQICQAVKEKNETNSIESCPCTVHTGSEISVKLSEEESTLPKASLGSQAVDSLTVVHVPDEDHNINYEKICPMEECQRMQVDSFMRSLPSYMRANPFTHFAQTYEDYEPCSPEQLEMLRQRLQERKKSHEILDLDESPTDEWGSETGVGVQTSDMSMVLPPCTCHAPSPSLASTDGMIFNIEDLLPFKEALDTIKEECFHDSKIQFDRFKVIGQTNEENNTKQKETRKSQAKFQEITKILARHPSLCEIFQGNTIR